MFSTFRGEHDEDLDNGKVGETPARLNPAAVRYTDIYRPLLLLNESTSSERRRGSKAPPLSSSSSLIILFSVAFSFVVFSKKYVVSTISWTRRGRRPNKEKEED